MCALPLVLNFKRRGGEGGVRSRGKEWNRLEDLLCFPLLSVILRHLICILREEGADREPWDWGEGRREGVGAEGAR